MEENVDAIVQLAIEASVVVSPRDHGLTPEELVQIGLTLGFKRGELTDAIGRARRLQHTSSGRLRFKPQGMGHLSVDFNEGCEPDYREPKAFEFIRVELISLAKGLGENFAQLARDVLVERGVLQGLKRADVELAITVTVMDRIFQEKDGIIRHAPDKLSYVLPSEQLKGHRDVYFKRPLLVKVLPVVQDAISRRTDGRASSANPLDAFQAMLGELGAGRFLAWWVQKRSELVTLDSSIHPVAITVLSAALAEAALAFVVIKAQDRGLMKSMDPQKPRQWKFVDLVKGAKSGDATIAILDERSAQRCLDLNEYRQRIHAGFLLDTSKGGPIPDLKPEQARDAVQTLDLLVRRILEWLETD